MTITKHNSILYTWKKLKPNIKYKMRIKESKEKKSSELENKNLKDLGYESSLSKESKFKYFCV